jgi:hypothetical protein
MPLYVVSFRADPLAVSKLSLHRMLVECETKERAREFGEEWPSSGQMGSLLNVQTSSLEVTEFSKFVMFEGEIYPRTGPSVAAEKTAELRETGTGRGRILAQDGLGPERFRSPGAPQVIVAFSIRGAPPASLVIALTPQLCYSL